MVVPLNKTRSQQCHLTLLYIKHEETLCNRKIALYNMFMTSPNIQEKRNSIVISCYCEDCEHTGYFEFKSSNKVDQWCRCKNKIGETSYLCRRNQHELLELDRAKRLKIRCLCYPEINISSTLLKNLRLLHLYQGEVYSTLLNGAKPGGKSISRLVRFGAVEVD